VYFVSWEWWHASVIPASMKTEREDHLEFRPSLGNTARPHHNSPPPPKKKKKKKGKSPLYLKE
jgi:hypothetical protein